MAKSIPVVTIGQVWEDNDPRHFIKRQVEIVSLDATHAVCRTLTGVKDRMRETRIRLDRFKPTSTGYRLVRQAARGAGEREGT